MRRRSTGWEERDGARPCSVSSTTCTRRSSVPAGPAGVQRGGGPGRQGRGARGGGVPVEGVECYLHSGTSTGRASTSTRCGGATGSGGIEMTAAGDNSAENPRNPNKPPKRVDWGERMVDEMGRAAVLFTFTTRRLRRA